ncbi:MAG: hypothetical protein KIT87_16890 [Anaerolineae bacterium]|nr:hypothetical protein [Anaerolineae bacterium]
MTLQPSLVWISVILWGAVMGIHETTLRAAVADLAPPERAQLWPVQHGVWGGLVREWGVDGLGL